MEVSKYTDEVLKLLKTSLKKCLIDPKEELQPPQIAWKMANHKTTGFSILGTLGNFSLIIGKAKSRKSFFINIAVSTAVSNDTILELFKSDLKHPKNKVLYFDTEQSKYHVQLSLKRVCKQINIDEPTNLKVYGLRSLPPAERLKLIEFAIYDDPNIGFVIIDGIKDLVTSINDEAEATMISSKLLKWTEELNIHIVTVLHQNKSDTNARGHIGTELINKAETVLSISKADTDNDISIVEPQQCRNKEPETFAFEIDEDGLPFIAVDYEIRTESKKQKFSVIDIEDFRKFQLLNAVYSYGNEFSYAKLVTQLKIVFKKEFDKDLGDNRAKELITICKNNGWLLQEKDKAPYTQGVYKSSV